MPRREVDYFAEGGARELARRIEAYWREQGRVAKVWVEPYVTRLNGERRHAWTVRSNIGLGGPVDA